MAKNAPQSNPAEIMPIIEIDTWVVEESAGPSFVGRLFAEFLGTFLFVLIGLGVAAFGFASSASTTLRGNTDIASLTGSFGGLNYAASLGNALAWAVALIALIVAVGRISGAHFNPAITLGMWIGGRMPGRDVAPYVVVQVLGALLAGTVVRTLLVGLPLFTTGSDLVAASGGAAPTVGQGMSFITIGGGVHSSTGATIAYAAIVEFIATAALVAVVLAATSRRAPKGQAPFTIGLAIAVLLLWAAPFSGGGLNPARITATALFASDAAGAHWAIGQLWIWWVVALLAGAFVGLLFRGFGPVEDLRAVETSDAQEL